MKGVEKNLPLIKNGGKAQYDTLEEELLVNYE